eukprot:540594_1
MQNYSIGILEAPTNKYLINKTQILLSMSLQKHAYFGLLAFILLGAGLTWKLFNISQHISNSNLSTTSQLDIFKYKSTNTNILVGSHHKTGSILLVSAITQRTFERYLKSICYHKNTTPLKYTLYGINK